MKNKNNIIVTFEVIIILILSIIAFTLYTNKLDKEEIKEEEKEEIKEDNYEEPTQDETNDNTKPAQPNEPEETIYKINYSFEFIDKYSYKWSTDPTNELGYIFSYPVINHNSEEIRSLNDKMKQTITNNLLRVKENLATEQDTACVEIKNNETKETEQLKIFDYFSYNYLENNRYLTLIEINTTQTCEDHIDKTDNIYIIDKSDLTIKNSDDLIKTVENIELIEAEFLVFITEEIMNDYYKEEGFKDKYTKEEMINEVHNILKNNEYGITYASEKLILFIKTENSYLPFAYLNGTWYHHSWYNK